MTPRQRKDVRELQLYLDGLRSRTEPVARRTFWNVVQYVFSIEGFILLLIALCVGGLILTALTDTSGPTRYGATLQECTAWCPAGVQKWNADYEEPHTTFTYANGHTVPVTFVTRTTRCECAQPAGT